MKCLELLRGMKNVDSRRVAAYGDGSGAFVTIGVAAERGSGLRTVIITAGGISSKTGNPAPTADIAKKIRVPMLILSGEADVNVPPERSLDLKNILDEQKVENERYVYPGGGHDIYRTQTADIYDRVKNWLTKLGVIKHPD